MKNLGKKQKITLIVIGIAIVLVLLVGASYAYFQSMIDTGKKAPVDVITDTTDNLVFDIEDNINLAINKYNFGPGNGDLTSHAKAMAKLRANSTDNTATYNYYLYFNIKSNEFAYTTEDHKPEIILTITDPNGNPVTSVTGLTYVTANGVSGFDITTASGLFEIANNYAITSNSSTEDTLQEWNFTATFINLDSDQNDNTGKSMNGTIMLRRSGLDVSLKYVCDADVFLADCIKTLKDDKNSSIIHHNGTILGEDGSTIIDANDFSYRYFGKNPSNFVCFGSKESTCPENNVYRIIGVFDNKIKLIKNTAATPEQLGTGDDYDSDNYYYWNKTNSELSQTETTYMNIWKYSILNTLNLNVNFLNNFSKEWQDAITLNKWIVAGNLSENIYDASIYEIIKNEMVNYTTEVDSYFEAKIGLMYLSDYYYANEKSVWELSGAESGEFFKNSWIYSGLDFEWTITRNHDEYNGVYAIYNDGSVGVDYCEQYPDAVRPVFYLNSNITYLSGNGTIENPIRIGV